MQATTPFERALKDTTQQIQQITVNFHNIAQNQRHAYETQSTHDIIVKLIEATETTAIAKYHNLVAVIATVINNAA